LRGVGVADAKSKLQIDRYSAISSEGASVSFLDEANTREGWKVALTDKDAWVQYNSVDFGNGNLGSVKVRAASPAGGVIEIHLDKADGPLLAKVEIGKNADWNVIASKLASAPSGIHDLVTVLGDKGQVELDWVGFE